MENKTSFNVTLCFMLELDLSEKSRTISSNRNLLLAISVVSSVIDLFIIISNATLVVALIKSSKESEGKVSMTSSNISKRSRLLMASISMCHTFIGAFLVPCAVTQMIHNGVWVLGPQMCTAKNVLEAVISASTQYHVICMALDMYLAICKPLAYRMLTSRSSHLMIWSSWILPLAIFVIPMLFGWHQLGKELVIMCQTVYGICSTVFNDYVLLFIAFFLSILPFAALITMYVLILRAIARFHDRLPGDKPRRIEKSTNTDQQSSMRLDSEVSEGVTDVSEVSVGLKRHTATIQNFDQNLNENIQKCKTKPQLNPTSILNEGSKTLERKRAEKTVVQGSSFGNFRKSCRNARAFRYILGILSWCAATSTIFIVSKIIQVFRPDLMPKWLGTALWWLSYLNSAVNPFLLCSNRNVRHCVETLIGVKLYRN
uniref:G-protein coupled receptors family 1 profile domain-containing protein n=1 Tax=Biomphalaria glabrata TaxID=6526 RepID=A0A2C9KL55_BIOGL